MLRAPSPGAPAPPGQARRDALGLSPQEKGHDGHCWDLQLLPLSLSHGNGHVGISSCFCEAKGDARGDGGVVLRAAGAAGSIDLSDAERCFLQWAP